MSKEKTQKLRNYKNYGDYLKAEIDPKNYKHYLKRYDKSNDVVLEYSNRKTKEDESKTS